ncbi:MAG: hypothetical protein GY833_22600 [Aestuariibacter sp.]|nr:hypothetical protein [Aestuariibacter sp.]
MEQHPLKVLFDVMGERRFDALPSDQQAEKIQLHDRVNVTASLARVSNSEYPKDLQFLRKQQLVKAESLRELNAIANSLRYLMQERAGYRSSKLGQYRDIASVLCGFSNYKAAFKQFNGSLDNSSLIPTLLLQQPVVVIDYNGRLSASYNDESEAIYVYKNNLYVLSPVAAKDSYTVDLQWTDTEVVQLSCITAGSADNDRSHYIEVVLREGDALGHIVADNSKTQAYLIRDLVYLYDGQDLTLSQREVDYDYALRHRLFSLINGTTEERYHIFFKSDGHSVVYCTDSDAQLRVMPREELMRLLEHPATMYCGRGDLARRDGYELKGTPSPYGQPSSNIILLMEDVDPDFEDKRHIVIYDAIGSDPIALSYMFIEDSLYQSEFADNSRYSYFEDTGQS